MDRDRNWTDGELINIQMDRLKTSRGNRRDRDGTGKSRKDGRK